MLEVLFDQKLDEVGGLEDAFSAPYGLDTSDALLVAVDPDLSLLIVLEVALRPAGKGEVRHDPLFELVVEHLREAQKPLPRRL